MPKHTTMGIVSPSNNMVTIAFLTLLFGLIPPSSAQSTGVCPEGGVSIAVLVGACCAVFAGTLLVEIIGYLAYQKWKKKRIKANTKEPSVVYSPSATINIEHDGIDTDPGARARSRSDSGVLLRSGSDSGRSSVYTISETKDTSSFFGSDRDSRTNSILDVANDFSNLPDAYRINWKMSSDNVDMVDDYDVLDKAFPILPPKLDAIDFTSARYKSSEINLAPDTNLIVGVAVKGDRESETTRTSASRTYRTSANSGNISHLSPIKSEDHKKKGRRSRDGQRYYDSVVVEIEPDQPSTSREARIEIDENFSIASSRRSDSSDEDLYDHGDVGRSAGHAKRHGDQGSRSTKRERGEIVRRQRHVVERRSSGLEGSAAMKASGARRAKSLVGETGHRSRYTRYTKPGDPGKGRPGHDYRVAKREILDGREHITLIRADQSAASSSTHERSSTTPSFLHRTSTTLPRSYSETGMDPRLRVSFREPLESVTPSDENSIRTFGVIHLVDDEARTGSSRQRPYRTRGRTQDKYKKNRAQRSRSESPFRYSERIEGALKEARQDRLSHFDRGSKEVSRSTTPSFDVPTIGVVKLVPHGAHSTSSLDSWLRDRSSLPARSVSAELHQHDDEVMTHDTHMRPRNLQGSFMRMVDVSTQCERPKMTTTATDPRVPWRRLLEEMEEIFVKAKSKSSKKKSTLSRLTGSRKGKKHDKSASNSLKKIESVEDGDAGSWNELLRDDKYQSKNETGSLREYRSSSAQSHVSASAYLGAARSKTFSPSTRSESSRYRARSVSPGRRHSKSPSNRRKIQTKDKSTQPEMTWPKLLEAAKRLTREEDNRRSRSPVKRSASDRDILLRLVSKGTQPDISWGMLMNLVEAKVEERIRNEHRYRKRSAPLVGRFSLKAEKKMKAPVADMGTSPELSWGDVVDIATAEAERNLKSRSVPDLRGANGPQNIGVFSLKEKKEMVAPLRSTGTETDLSFTDIVDIVLEELLLLQKETSSSRRSISYDRQTVIDRAKSMGIVHLRSKSEERPKGRNFGTQSELNWAQLIQIVEEEARRMIMQQKNDSLSEMGTDPLITWTDLIETIHDESGEYWKYRKRNTSVERGVQPSWNWSDIVRVIQEETEKIVRMQSLNNMKSHFTQTENNSSLTASNLRRWLRDRPRRVKWEEATEPEIEWDRLVNEIEGSAIDHFIKTNGLDQPREAPLVSVFKLRKGDEIPKVTKTDSGTNPVIDWQSFVTEVQEDAVDSYKNVLNKKEEEEVVKRVPVAAVFKLKQEEKISVERRNSGTNPLQPWNDIVDDIEMSAIESYRKANKHDTPINLGVIKLKASPTEKEECYTQSEENWSDIITELREEFENEYRRTIRELQSRVDETEESMIRRQKIQRQKHLDLMISTSAQVDIETVDSGFGNEYDYADVYDAYTQVAVRREDKNTQPDRSWGEIINHVQEETEESMIRRQKIQRQKHLDLMISTSAQVDIETVDSGFGNEYDYVDVYDAYTQVAVRREDKNTQPDRSWGEIINHVQEETEESMIRRQKIKRQEQLELMISTSAQVDVETRDAGVGNEHDFLDAGTQIAVTAQENSTDPEWSWDAIVNRVQEETEESMIRHQKINRQKQLDLMLSISVQTDLETVHACVGNEDGYVDAYDAGTQVAVRMHDKATESSYNTSESGVQVVSNTSHIGISAVQQTKDSESTTTMLDVFTTSSQTEVNKVDAAVGDGGGITGMHDVSSQVAVKGLDKATEVESQTSEVGIYVVQSTKDVGSDALFHQTISTTVQAVAETMEVCIGDTEIHDEEDILETHDACTQVVIRRHDKYTEAAQRVVNSGAQAVSKTSDISISVIQPMTDTGSDSVVCHMQSIGLTCAPEMVDSHATAKEPHTDVISTATQVVPGNTSLGTITERPQLNSTLTQCKPDVSSASVEVKQTMSDQIQQTRIETSSQNMMTDEIKKDLHDRGLQAAPIQLSQTSQTNIKTYDASMMTDIVETVEEVTLAEEFEEKSEVSSIDQDVREPQTDTYETWTFTDGKVCDAGSEVCIREFEEEVRGTSVVTASFSQQVGDDIVTHDRSILVLPETRSAHTETAIVQLESRQIQASVEINTKSSVAVPDTLAMTTQTCRVFSHDTECQVSAEIPTSCNEASMIKPETNSSATYMSDDESDTDSGIEMDCQTQPVVVFSIDEYEQIEKDIGEYKLMQKHIEELQERLKEFEGMAEFEQTDVCIETDLPDVEHGTTQTSQTIVRTGGSQTIVDLNDRSTSPIPLDIIDTPSQTVLTKTRENATEIDEVANQTQSTQVSPEARNFGVETEKTEIHEVSIQASVRSCERSIQYNRNEEHIGIQAEINVESTTQGSQIAASTNARATATEVSHANEMSTQSTVVVMDNDSQYERAEKAMGTQTTSKMLKETSTETLEHVVEEIPHTTASTNTERVAFKDSGVRTDDIASLTCLTQTEIKLNDKMSQVEKSEGTSTTQTDAVAVRDQMLDPILPPVSEAQIQVQEPDIISSIKVTQTERNLLESVSAQTDKVEHATKDATTSPHLDVADRDIQTVRVTTETTSSQYDNVTTSSLTQTDTEKQSHVTDVATWMNLDSKSFSGQTDITPHETQGVQFAVETYHSESQTEVQPSLDAESNTAQCEFSETSVQTVMTEIPSQASHTQYSTEVTDNCSQTKSLSVKDSSCETEKKKLTDQQIGTNEVILHDTGSQVTYSVSNQQSQCQVSMRPLQVQTNVIETDNSSTSARSPIIMGDSSTQYESKLDEESVQTESISTVARHVSTEPILAVTTVTQTEVEKKDVHDSVAQTSVDIREIGVSVRIQNETNDTGVQVTTEKVVETETVGIHQEQATKPFQSQTEEEKVHQQEKGTEYKPDTARISHQFNPETSIFGVTTAPLTSDRGTIMEHPGQHETASQMTPASDNKLTQVQTDTTQRSLSTLPISMFTTATQIDIVPVHTSVLQTQVNDAEDSSEKNGQQDVVRVTDAVTQTHATSIDFSTQTLLKTGRSDALGLQDDRLQRNAVISPEQRNRGTATYSYMRKDMGTQFITRVTADRPRDVTLTSEGTLTDKATRVTSTTQTSLSRVANSGVQIMPQTSSVGVFSEMKPSTVNTGIMTSPKRVRNVPIQKDEPERRIEQLIDRHIQPETTRAISPNTMEKVETELIAKIKLQLHSQVRKDVEAEYVSKVLPGLVEQALQERLVLDKRSRPKSRDAVTSPLRGRSIERSVQHTESWPFASTEEPEMSKLEEKELNILRANTRRELKVELSAQVRKEVEREVRQEVARQVDNDVRRQVAREVESKVRKQVAADVRNDVIRAMKEELNESVKREVALDVRSEVKKEIAAEVRPEVKKDVRSELRDEVRLRLRGEMKEDVRKELRIELRSDVTKELKDSLKSNVVRQLQSQLIPEVRQQLTDRLIPSVKTELLEKYRAEFFLHEENRMKEQLTETVRKELRAENIALLTSKPQLIDRGTSAVPNRTASAATQVDRRINDHGVQCDEPKPRQVEKGSQIQCIVSERGTSTEKQQVKEFTIQIEPIVTEIGLNTITHVTTKNFALQTERPDIEQKHRSDQYVYIPPRLEEATQSTNNNTLINTSVQASPQKADKSIFYSHVMAASPGMLASGDERKIQESQVHRQVQESGMRNQEIQVHRQVKTAHGKYADAGYAMSSQQSHPLSKDTLSVNRTAQRLSTESKTSQVRGPDRETDTIDRHVQIKSVMRDDTNSPVQFTGIANPKLPVPKPVHPIHMLPGNTRMDTSLSQRAEHTSVQAQQHRSSSSDKHSNNRQPISPSSESQRRILRTIQEEPVKLSRTSNTSRASAIEIARLDESLFNLLKQAEKLGPVGRVPTASKTTTFSRVTTTTTPARTVDVVTTILQKLPPRCRVLLLQQSAPGAIFTTAILTMANVVPTMSTGFNQSHWSNNVPVLPALTGPTREPTFILPAVSETDSDEVKPGARRDEKDSKTPRKTPSVRFADQADLQSKTQSKADHLSQKITTKRSDPIDIPEERFELRQQSKGIATRLHELCGESPPERDYPSLSGSLHPLVSKQYTGDVDSTTGESETDSEPLKSILRKRESSSPRSGQHKLHLAKRKENRDEMTTDSSSSSISDQYNVTGSSAKDSTPAKLPPVVALRRERGKIKQDLSMSGVIESKSKTMLTGYRSFDSSREGSTGRRRSAAHHQPPKSQMYSKTL